MGRRKKGERQKAVIAGLPLGINVFKDGNGFRVMLGKKFTGHDIIKRRFSSRKAAEEFINGDEAQKLKQRTPGVVDLQRDLGQTAFDVPRGVYAEAATAWKELQKVHSPGGILEAVRFYIKHTALTEGRWKIEEAAAALDKELAGLKRDERYRKGLGWTYGRLAEDFPDTHLNDISKSDIIEWLAEEDFEPVTRNNYIRDLKMLFTFAVSEKRLGLSPMDNIARQEVPDSEVEILSIRDTARVLFASMHIPGMSVPTAIKFFAGLRTSEVRRLEWGEIHDEAIVVQARKAKTRSRRAVSVPSNLRQWIPKDRPEQGHVSLPGSNWKAGFEILKASLGATPWPRNCQRHGYGSYHLAKHKNENLCASEMGNSPDIVVRHYRSVVFSTKDIAAYWSLTPANVEKFAKPDKEFFAGLEAQGLSLKRR